MRQQLHLDISRTIGRAARVHDESRALVQECRLSMTALEQTVVDCRLMRGARTASRRRRGAPAFGNGQSDAGKPSGPG